MFPPNAFLRSTCGLARNDSDERLFDMAATWVTTFLHAIFGLAPTQVLKRKESEHER
ncbi:MAG TPA: hypothetical protein VNZ55_02885 [Thermomicrobiales bacterium]|nr:hypothetical protein [Thermomicrobiales bacterium]